MTLSALPVCSRRIPTFAKEWARISSSISPKTLDVSGWTNIVDVAAESVSGMGLTADGNVLTLGNRTVSPSWRGVQRLESGKEIYAPFWVDGTYDIYYTNEGVSDEYTKAKFGDIANIAISTFYCIGIKENGTVVTDDSLSGQRLELELSQWQDVVSVGASEEYAVGLKSDGTLYAFKPLDEALDEGQADVNDWTDIMQIAVSRFKTTVGLKTDGTVLCTNRDIDVSGLSNIAKVECEDSLVVALTNDGRLLFRGDYFFFGSNSAESMVVSAR